MLPVCCLTRICTVSQADNVLPDDVTDAAHVGLAPERIAASNVRPAYEASVKFGVTEAELESACGLKRAVLERPGAQVSGAATYAHMEFMAGRPGFGAFLIAAVRMHTMSSLGVVGLACKTVSNLGEAMACHQRYQALINRTAEYSLVAGSDALVLNQARFGPDRPGKELVSDYALLIAVQLLRDSTTGSLGVRGLESRRPAVDDATRSAIEGFLAAPLTTGAAHSRLILAPNVPTLPVKTEDPELARYFEQVLAHARATVTPDADVPPTVVTRAAGAIVDSLIHGTPTVDDVAKSLGMGGRTLQRRLGEHALKFAELLDATRRDVAERHLANERLTLAEVAYLLGYRDQASFFRSFRRWYDTTPGAYRTAMAAG